MGFVEFKNLYYQVLQLDRGLATYDFRAACDSLVLMLQLFVTIIKATLIQIKHAKRKLSMRRDILSISRGRAVNQ